MSRFEGHVRSQSDSSDDDEVIATLSGDSTDDVQEFYDPTSEVFQTFKGCTGGGGGGL